MERLLVSGEGGEPMSDESEQQPQSDEEEKTIGESNVDASAEKTEDVPGATPMALENLDGSGSVEPASSIDMIVDVSLNVRIELGRSKMAVEDILKLQAGSVVTLDKLAGDFVDVLVNDRLVARGEVLILNDNFCVRIAEIISPEERLGQTN